MQFKDSYRFGPYDYALSREKQVVGNNAKFLYGEAVYSEQKIRLSSKYPIQTQEIALLHEALHVIDDIWQVGLKENQIAALAPALMSFLKDNDLLKD